MRGIVHSMNPRRGMVAIQTESAGFTIIELMSDDDIEVGDEMSWADDTAMGSEVYTNRTKGVRFEVYVQNHWVSPQQLKQQLLLT